jgi:branched-chain amino acid transport system permease protein
MLSVCLTILLDGLSYGMVLFLISVGLTITMGLMRVVNLAHGTFAMVGGYIAAWLTQNGANFYVSLLAAALGAGVLGAIAEITFYRRLYRKGQLAQVLMTIGLVFVGTAAVAAIFGAFPYPVVVPHLLTQPVNIGFRTYPAYPLFVLAVGALIAGLLWVVIDHSLVGARLRAAVDNAQMAGALGMNVRLLFALTFAVGCALAGFGGAIGADVLALEPSYALNYLIIFLIVVIVGGEGSFGGSFIAAMALGLVDTIGKYFISAAAAYVIYVAVFFLLLWRPNGLLPAFSRRP